eukprot:g48989.t1
MTEYVAQSPLSPQAQCRMLSEVHTPTTARLKEPQFSFVPSGLKTQPNFGTHRSSLNDTTLTHFIAQLNDRHQLGYNDKARRDIVATLLLSGHLTAADLAIPTCTSVQRLTTIGIPPAFVSAIQAYFSPDPSTPAAALPHPQQENLENMPLGVAATMPESTALLSSSQLSSLSSLASSYSNNLNNNHTANTNIPTPHSPSSSYPPSNLLSPTLPSSFPPQSQPTNPAEAAGSSVPSLTSPIPSVVAAAAISRSRAGGTIPPPLPPRPKTTHSPPRTVSSAAAVTPVNTVYTTPPSGPSTGPAGVLPVPQQLRGGVGAGQDRPLVAQSSLLGSRESPRRPSHPPPSPPRPRLRPQQLQMMLTPSQQPPQQSQQQQQPAIAQYQPSTAHPLLPPQPQHEFKPQVQSHPLLPTSVFSSAMSSSSTSSLCHSPPRVSRTTAPAHPSLPPPPTPAASEMSLVIPRAMSESESISTSMSTSSTVSTPDRPVVFKPSDTHNVDPLSPIRSVRATPMGDVHLSPTRNGARGQSGMPISPTRTGHANSNGTYRSSSARLQHSPSRQRNRQPYPNVARSRETANKSSRETSNTSHNNIRLQRENEHDSSRRQHVRNRDARDERYGRSPRTSHADSNDTCSPSHDHSSREHSPSRTKRTESPLLPSSFEKGKDEGERGVTNFHVPHSVSSSLDSEGWIILDQKHYQWPPSAFSDGSQIRLEPYVHQGLDIIDLGKVDEGKSPKRSRIRPASGSKCTILRSDEEVYFETVVASWDTSLGLWRIPLHAFVTKPPSLGRALQVGAMRRLLGVPPQLPSAQMAEFEQKVLPFLGTAVSGRLLRIGLRVPRKHLSFPYNSPKRERKDIDKAKTNDQSTKIITLNLGETNRDGHVHRTVGLGLPASHREPVRVQLLLPKHDGRQLYASINFESPRGVAVISDIDDTVKDTQVSVKSEQLANTFYRQWRPVPGMSEAYQQWHVAHKCSFHYVSGSPWQLLPPLRKFLLENGFPMQGLTLRHLRLGLGRAPLVFLQNSPQYKMRRIRDIMERYPNKKFLLIGDSAEEDADVYAQIFREKPNQILLILIRAVEREDAHREDWKKTFAGVPGNLWHVFYHVSELPERLDNLANYVRDVRNMKKRMRRPTPPPESPEYSD